MLQSYLNDVRDLLRDVNAQFYSTTQLTRYINQARYQVVQMTGCIQILVAGGSPFGSDTTVGTALVGGAVVGAQGNPQGKSVFNTIPGVEMYPFNLANAIVQAQNGGVKGVVDVMSVSVSWGGMRPTLNWMPLEDAQAFLRAWNVNTQSYPSVWSTNGTGEQGQVFLYPIPGTASEMEWLCSCAPIDLNLDSDVEAIPRPYQDAVKYWAASRAFLASNRTGLASEMDKEFNNHLILAGVASDRGKIPCAYS